jgi:hypothetical protein
LLQRDTEQGRPADLVTHDLQILVDVSPLLHVVGQVEVRVVEEVVGRRDGGRICEPVLPPITPAISAVTCARRTLRRRKPKELMTGSTACWESSTESHGNIQSNRSGKVDDVTAAALLEHENRSPPFNRSTRAG